MISNRYLSWMRIIHNITFPLGICSIRTNTASKRNFTSIYSKYRRKSYMHVFLCLCWLLEFVIRLRISFKQGNINSFNVGGAFFIIMIGGTIFVCLEVFFADQLCRVGNGIFSLFQHIQGKICKKKYCKKIFAFFNRKLLLFCKHFQKSTSKDFKARSVLSTKYTMQWLHVSVWA